MVSKKIVAISLALVSLLSCASVEKSHAMPLFVGAVRKKQLNAALLQAVETGSTARVKELLGKGANADAGGLKGKYGRSLLLLAAVNDCSDIARLLIEHGANVNAKDVFGDTPLINMAFHGRKELAELLLKHGANVNARRNYGAHALILASADGQADMVKLLLDKGADVNMQEGSGIPVCIGYTALMYAAARGHTHIVKLLLAKGANVNIKSVPAMTGNGTVIAAKTAIQIAKENHHTDIVELLRQTEAKK